MKRIKLRFLTLLACFSATISAQQTRSLAPQIRTVRVIVNDDPLQAPIARIDAPVEISFDELSHEYTRYIYKVEYCNADWSVNDEIYESDYLEGFNGQPVDDYEKSFNTTVLYFCRRERQQRRPCARSLFLAL